MDATLSLVTLVDRISYAQVRGFMCPRDRCHVSEGNPNMLAAILLNGEPVGFLP